MTDKPLQKHQGEKHDGPDHTAPYPVSRMAPAIELVDLAREIAEADKMLGNVTHGKLKLIAEQMQALQRQAREVLEQTRRDQELHRAQCNFKRIPGRTYHLYRRGDGSLYFSMLSPQEWRGEPPHRFEGSFRLESDMSWVSAEALERRPSEHELLDRLLLGSDDSIG